MDRDIISEGKDRVRLHGPQAANQQIDRGILARLLSLKGSPQAIEDRLRELDAEWDIERVFIAQSAALSLLGVALAARFGRKWMLLPAVVLSFLLQHALQSWCPPVEIWRRAGLATRREIEAEKFAFKALRGDFERARGRVEEAVAAVKY
jgi:hypothetical protein